MRISLTKKLLAIILMGVFSQVSLADNASATKTIAGILATLNHFPSDDDKASLMAIADDDGTGRAFRAVASAVSNIQHAATDDDKEIMNRIIASERAAADAKALAEIVLGLNHAASSEAKATLQAML